MSKFFRKLRQGNLSNKKIGSYLIYAIGEILLLVIGILIAVSINNKNEQNKLNLQLSSYKKSLFLELEEDVTNLKDLQKSLESKRSSIINYVDYFNSNEPNTNVLWGKLDSVNYSRTAFYTVSYTIEDLITTGNLSLLTEEEKNTILKLKNIHERFLYYETETIENITLYEVELKKKTDLMFMLGYSGKPHVSVGDWRHDLDSEQFRILNNTIAESLKLYDFQQELYQTLIEETQFLMTLLNRQKNL